MGVNIRMDNRGIRIDNRGRIDNGVGLIAGIGLIRGVNIRMDNG